MSPLLLDHLWQSTLVLAGIGGLTLFFRKNGAPVRHALWMAASLKFLLPFAALNEFGRYLSTLLAAPPVQPPVVQVAFAVSQPFSDGPVFVALPAPNAYLLPATLVWIAGFLTVVGFWLSRWWTLRAVLRAARASDIAAPMPVKLSATLLEPGLVGIVRPVLLLAEGIAEKLSPAELAAIVAHETCHLRRRDNPTAALHMLVEALFWFWPPVWWLGTRLIAEREKACDEAVLATGNDPQIYAESILKVCKHYVSSPLACASGVSGADLKQRMEDIMKNAVIARLNVPKKFLLTAFAVGALMLPLAAGLFVSPMAMAQTAVPVLRDMIKRDNKNPSPGLSEALRQNSEALSRGAPNYGLMTPRMQSATKGALNLLLENARRLGPIKTIAFHGIDEKGMDICDVTYRNGTATYWAAPLVGGKLDKLMWGDLLVQGEPQHPGTAAAVQKYVEALQKGAPDYADMTPRMAMELRKDYDFSRNLVLPLGAQKDVVYKGAGWENLDTFEIAYEHGKVKWIVAPLENGKLTNIAGTLMQPAGGGLHSEIHVGFWAF